MGKRFTEISVKAAQPHKDRYEISDGGGLYLRVTPSGVKSWTVPYRRQSDGLSRRVTLGKYPALGLAEARKLAKAALGEVAKGNDPAADKRAKRDAGKAAANRGGLVKNVFADYIHLRASRETADWKETKRLLDRNVVPAWGERPIVGIDRPDIHKLEDEIKLRAPGTANHVRAACSTVWSWALNRGIITHNPYPGLKKPSPEVARDRFLAPDELVLFLKAVETFSPAYRGVLKVLAYTGQRLGEVTGMRWSELNADLTMWTLPAARVKNRRQHMVPLSAPVRALLEALPRGEPDAAVFSETGRPLANFSYAKTKLDAAIAGLNDGPPVPPWVLHDLRRTVATGMAELNVPPHVVEAILNHRSGIVSGVAAVYNRYSYGLEKRSALEAWARQVAVYCGAAPDNVVALAAVRA